MLTPPAARDDGPAPGTDHGVVAARDLAPGSAPGHGLRLRGDPVSPAPGGTSPGLGSPPPRSPAASASLTLALAAIALTALAPWPPLQHALAGLAGATALLNTRTLLTGRIPRDDRPLTIHGHSAATGTTPAERGLTTVLFTDIVGSTERAATLGDAAWKDLLDRHDVLLRTELRRHGGRQVTTTGDGVLATFDLPGDGVRCALAVAAAVRALGLEVRAGLHTTEVERRGGDVAGLGVHVGARVGALAGPGEVLVSRTVAELAAGAGLRFRHHGTHRLRGVPGEWSLLTALPGDRLDHCP